MADSSTTLLAEFQKTPSRALFEAIIGLDAGEPFAGSADEWCTRARKAKPAERGPLIAALLTGKLAEVAQKLKAAEALATDPRVVAALEGAVMSPPWSSDTSKSTWRPLFELISRTNSPRFAELRPEWNVRPLIKGWLENAFTKSIAALPKSWPEGGAKVIPAPPKAKKSAGGKSDEALLAAVYANPDDDAPRLVYADLLIERGDPRGEFIALQCQHGDPKKQKALLKAHGANWLGALAPVLGREFEFRRGFLAVASARFKNKGDSDKYGSLPEWATVEELKWIRPGQEPEGQEPYIRFLGPTMTNLRKLEGAWAPHLLKSKKPAAYTSITELGFEDQDDFVKFLDSPLFPKLEELGADWLTEEVEPQLMALKKLGPVKHLHVGWAVNSPRVLRHFDKLGAQVLEAYRYRWDRAADGSLTKLTVDMHLRRNESAGTRDFMFQQDLRNIADGVATEIIITPEQFALDPRAEPIIKTKLVKAKKAS